MAPNDVNPNLNQNVWALVVFLAALGAAEYWHLKWVCRLALGPAAVLTLCVLVSMFIYTLHYCKKKWLDFRNLS